MLPRSWLLAVCGLGLFVAALLTSIVRADAVLTHVVRQVPLDVPAQSDPVIVRSRYVAMARGVLPVPSGTDPRLDRVTPPIVLDLFDDVSVVAEFDRFDPNRHGVTWVGRVQGSEGSTVTLVYGDDGLVQGNVLMLDATYTIRPAPEEVRASNPETAGVLHVIAQVDLSRQRSRARGVGVGRSAVDRGASTAGFQPLADPADFIDLLVVYTPAATAFFGSGAALRSRVELLVSETNTSFVNSGVTPRIRLSHVAQVPYAEANVDWSYFTDLENLRGGAPGLDGVAALRDLHSADLVMLVARNDDPFSACGTSYHMEVPAPGFAAFAFSISDVWCLSTAHVFAEVLGQNMGLRSDWYIDNGTTPYTYAHGHVNYAPAGTRFQTLMTSHELCTSQGVACPALLRWSNPSQTLNGVPLGVPPGTRSNCAVGAADANTCDADSRLALNNVALLVANFRDAPEIPPRAFSKSAPADQAVFPWNDFAPTLSWQSAPLAESYEYCHDTTNNDACDGTWTSTTALSAPMTGFLPGTTFYWQVRAVNAYGVTLANGGTWWRFTKHVEPPAAFSKTAPANGALGQPTTLTLSWQESLRAASYEYCYDTTNNSACDGSWIATGATSAIINGLSLSAVYYWQVRAINVSGSVQANFNNIWWSFATPFDPPPAYPVTTLAGLAGATGGTDGAGSAARFTSPYGVAVDVAGTIYVADSFEHTIRKITPAGVVTTLAGLARTSGSTDGTGSAARFNGPRGVAVDAAGTLYVADANNSTIRKITPAGVVSTLAGLAGSSGSTDGTGSAARFTTPEGVAVNAAGLVYVADSFRNTIRAITPAGVVSTLAGSAFVSGGNADGVGSAARFNRPSGLALSSAGLLYVADSSNHTIRKVTPAGAVTTTAGSMGSADGVGRAAGFSFPAGVAVDSTGVVYVADSANHTLRRITPLGVVTTLAGQAGAFGSADGVGSAARFRTPIGLAVDSTGTLFVADRDNNTIRRRGPTAGPNLVANADFSGGSANWNAFATPDSSYVSMAIVNGVLEFTRVPPPPGNSSSATVFQNTGQALPANTSLLARFALGNSSTVRKRISVLVLDHDFSDLSVCTFWLPPQLPLTTYAIRTYTTRAWANAAIYFYAATAGSDGGAYRVDDVSLQVQTDGPIRSTTCLDPLVPEATGQPDGSTLLGNGDFAAGALGPWGVFGTLTHQITGGVFEFLRPNNTPPAGVVFQATGQAMAANQILSATFQLGNSSPVRKRVTVILHDTDFSDLSACTFWLPPGQALSDYVYRAYTTKPWANAMLSVYAASIDAQQWIRLDNVTLRRTSGTTITGTQCVEPGGG